MLRILSTALFQMRMNTFHYFPAAVILLTLTACSSGSSNDPAPQASTNIEPAEANSTANVTASPAQNDTDQINGDGSATTNDNTSSNAGTASAGINAPPVNDAQAETVPDADPEVVSGAVTETMDTGAESTQDSGSTGNAEGESDVAADAGDQAVTDAETQPEVQTEPEAQPDAPPEADAPVTINPETQLGQLQIRINALVGRSLLTLNQQLSQGELLSAQEELCLGSYDPAIGEPLLAINCERPLSVGNVPIFATTAAFENTGNCIASLQNNNVENCLVSVADLTVNTLWVIPPTDTGQPERPRPTPGASIQYNIEQGVLSLDNLPAALAGVFHCEYSLNSGSAEGSSAGSNCESHLSRINALIDDHLLNAF